MTAAEEIEVGLVMLLGLPRELASAAVAAVADSEAADQGVVLTGAVAAARWGCDLSEALRRFASGERVPVGWSDYEDRVAREEAAEDLRIAGSADPAEVERLQRLARERDDDAVRGLSVEVWGAGRAD